MFLEDLFVREAFRGLKVGKGLMAAVASIAQREGCHALRWEVLAWNQAAVKWYESLGAEFLDDWRSAILKDEGCGDWRRLLREPLRQNHWCGSGGVGSGVAVRSARCWSGTLRDAPRAVDSGASDC